MVAKKPKVSIVVPIYNVERYLDECVKSIINQTLKEIEIILVDDGSPDNCGKIIDDYAKTDSRIVAVHQKNSGYSAAVNKGINMAKGEYVGIIESDDFIEPDMYQLLYEDAKKLNTDVTKGLFYYYNPTLPDDRKNVIWKNPSGIDLRFAPDGAFKAYEWPQIIGFHSSIWSSIYRADFVKKICIPETAGASYQDFPFMMEVMTKAERISVVKKPFVHWRNEPKQGNSTSASGKKLLLMAKNTKTGLEIIKASKHYDELKEAFYAHALWTNIGFFYRIKNKYKAEYYNDLRDIFSNLKTDKNFSYKFFRPEDKMSVRAILNNKTYPAFYASHILGGIRRKTNTFIHRYLLAGKRLYSIEEQLAELKLQNELLEKELKKK